MPSNSISIAFSNSSVAIRTSTLVEMCGCQDIRQRYQRPTLVAFWLTINLNNNFLRIVQRQHLT